MVARALQARCVRALKDDGWVELTFGKRAWLVRPCLAYQSSLAELNAGKSMSILALGSSCGEERASLRGRRSLRTWHNWQPCRPTVLTLAPARVWG